MAYFRLKHAALLKMWTLLPDEDETDNVIVYGIDK
jgi:hypothetical protein